MKAGENRFRELALQGLGDEYSRVFLRLLSDGFAILRRIGMASFEDPEGALERSRSIRAYSVERMPELLEEFEANAEAKGAKVLWAEDGLQACETVLGLAMDRGVSFVAKGKSMITEEIGLNKHLEKNGVKVLETDLGEFITQLMGLMPFHLVGPAINVPPEKIGSAFLEKGLICEHTSDAVRLGRAVREHLRERFRRLDMGVVGVNMAVAATGTVVNVENEGNIRMIKSSPRTLVAVMSPEKVVPTMQDALHLLRVLCRNCTGQKIAGSVTFDTGPAAPGEKDGPEELYIIIVDNGRSTIYQSPLTRQVLRCIRCGACMNTCPVYTRIGGYPYGDVYTGPMGVVLTPLLCGLEDTSDLYGACTLCGACRDVCPAGIDHPALVTAYREQARMSRRSRNVTGAGLLGEALLAAFGLVASGPRAWSATVAAARLARRLLGDELMARVSPGGLQAWLSCRDLPPAADLTFHEWWRLHKGGAHPCKEGEGSA
jgi:L-lactate dehydrogenase complex protein LldF